MKLKFKLIHENAILPKFLKVGDSGMDLHAIEDITLHPGTTHLIRTGLTCDIPDNTEIQIRPRSGLSLKTSLRITNSPGTIDKNFKGEWMVIMENTALERDITIHKGDRIAQAVLCPVLYPEIELVDDIGISERNESGFGSSGT